MSNSPINPFPGLRPFKTEEDWLFFGREAQTAALLTLLRTHRFLAVVGASGSGKSSLVRAGMIPALYGGTMASAGSHWEVVMMRPGGDPISNLAEALHEADLYDADDSESRDQVRATLTRTRFGLVEAIRQSEAVSAGVNTFVLVDQFEELFRFGEGDHRRQESALEFVNLLLTASETNDIPIYIGLTMRSDYLGDCAQIPGLAQAVNRGEFLIPRLTREQQRNAIEKPVGVGGATITPRLTQQMLNDVGDDPDQLPILQHALMRTWEAWAADHADGTAIDLEHYESVGGMGQSLSRHADEIMTGLADDHHRQVAELLFKTLTVKGTDHRGVRRPTSLENLGRITGADREVVGHVIDAFRAPGVTFLMPGIERELRESTIVDISHESLMRGWQRLRQWVDEESQSARVFQRLAETSRLWQQGNAGLYRDPDLSIAASWWENRQPNEAWAAQYGGGFELSDQFLKASRDAADASARSEAEARQRELEQAQQLAATEARAARQFKRFAISVAAFAAVVTLLAAAAFTLWRRAEVNRIAAENSQQQTEQALQLAHQSEQAATVAQKKTAELLEQSRHDQGMIWLERAANQFADKEHFGAKVMAAKAIGFEGFGADQMDDAFRLANPALLRQGSADWNEALSLIEQIPAYELVWASPARPLSSTHHHAAINADGTIIGWSDHSKIVPRWDAATGRQLPALELGGSFNLIKFLSRDRAVTTGILNLYNSQTGQKIGVDLRNYSFLALSSDGSRFLVAGNDAIGVVDAETGQFVGEMIQVDWVKRGEAAGDDIAYAFAPGNEQLLVASDSSLFVLDLDSDEPARQVGDYAGDELLGLTCTRDGKYLALAGVTVRQRERSPWIRVWDLQTYELKYERPVPMESGEIGMLTGSRIWLDGGEPAGHLSPIFDCQRGQLIGFAPGSVLATASAGETALIQAGDELDLWETSKVIESDAQLGPGWGPVGTALFTADGRNIVSHDIGAIRWWDAATGKQTDQVLSSGNRSMVLSPDGRHLIIHDRSGNTKLWDAIDRKQLAVLSSTGGKAGFHPSGHELVIVNADGTADVVALESRQITKTFRWRPNSEDDHAEANQVNCVRYLPGGTSMIVGGEFAEERGAWIVDLDSTESSEFFDDGAVVNAVVSASGKRVALSTDSALVIVDRETGEDYELPTSDDIRTASVLAISPSGARLAAGNADSGKVEIWNLISKQLEVVLPAHYSRVRSVDFSPDGLTLLTAGFDGTIKLWELEQDLSLSDSVANGRPGSRAGIIAYLPDADRILLVRNRSVQIRSAINGALIDERRYDRERFNSFNQDSVALSPDGKRVACFASVTGDDAPSVHVIDLDRNLEVHSVEHDEAPSDLAYSIDGTQLLTLAENRMHVWSADTLEQIDSWEIGGEPNQFALSPVGSMIAFGFGDRIELWDGEARALRATIPLGESWTNFLIAFDPVGGEFLAATRQGGMSIWRVDQPQPARVINEESRDAITVPMSILLWTPDGTNVITYGDGFDLLVRNVSSGQVIAKFSGGPWSGDLNKDAPKVSVGYAISPDGSTVATMTIGGALRFWDWEGKRNNDSAVNSQYARYLSVYEFGQVSMTTIGRQARSSGDAPSEQGPTPQASSEENSASAETPPAQRSAGTRASGELVPRTYDDLFQEPFELPLSPIAANTHIAVLRSELPESEKLKNLFDVYLVGQNWNAAAAVLRALGPDNSDSERAEFTDKLLDAVGTLTDSKESRTIAGIWLDLAAEFQSEDPRIEQLRKRVEIAADPAESAESQADEASSKQD